MMVPTTSARRGDAKKMSASTKPTPEEIAKARLMFQKIVKKDQGEDEYITIRRKDVEHILSIIRKAEKVLSEASP